MTSLNEMYSWLTKGLVITIFLSLFSFLFLTKITPAHSAITHIVISEIQIAGATAQDEFVELYNPTGDAVDLTGWRLTRKTQTGITESNLVASMSGTIAPRGYFLIAHSAEKYDGGVTPDLYYSAPSNSIAADNTILLYSDNGTTIVDKVGLGLASDKEIAAAPNPTTNGSVERTQDDTNNNYADFTLQSVSDPQNSSSPTTPPSETSTPTPTPTVTPTLYPSTTPSSTPHSIFRPPLAIKIKIPLIHFPKIPHI